MAINWKHIKGVNGPTGSTITTITYMTFAPNVNLSAEENNCPTLSITGNFSDPNYATPLGHIVTTNVANTFLKPQWANLIFFGGTTHPTGTLIEGDENYFHIKSPQMNYETPGGAVSLSPTGIILNSHTVVIQGPNNMFNKFDGTGFTSNQRVQAAFFNSTSDARAKENLQPVTISVLPLIKKLPLYTFNYKQNHVQSLGILAQDVIDWNFNGFSLVDNKQATGLPPDFMELREDKLIFVLLKAVQELTAEVEELKKELNK